jgi:hypothetical protein
MHSWTHPHTVGTRVESPTIQFCPGLLTPAILLCIFPVRQVMAHSALRRPVKPDRRLPNLPGRRDMGDEEHKMSAHTQVYQA